MMKLKYFIISMLLVANSIFAHTLEVDLITDTDRTWGWVNNETTTEYEIYQVNYYHRFHGVGDVIPTLSDSLTGEWAVFLEGQDYSKFDEELKNSLKSVFGQRFNLTTDNNSEVYRLPNLSTKYLVGYRYSNVQSSDPGLPLSSLSGDNLYVLGEVPNIKGTVTAGFLNTEGSGSGTFPNQQAFSAATGVFAVEDNSGQIARWTMNLSKKDAYKKFSFDASRGSSPSYYKNGGKPSVPAVRVRYKTFWKIPPTEEMVKIKKKGEQTTAKQQTLKVTSGCKYPGLIDWVSPRSTQGVTSRAIHAFFMMNFCSNRFTVATQSTKQKISQNVIELNTAFINDDPDSERTAATEEWVKNNFMRRHAFINVEDYVSNTSSNPVSARGVFKFVSDTVTNLTMFVKNDNPMSSGVLNEYAKINDLVELKAGIQENSDMISELDSEIKTIQENLKSTTNQFENPISYSSLTNFVDSRILEKSKKENDETIKSAMYFYDAQDEFKMQEAGAKVIPRVWKVFVFNGELCVKDITLEEELNYLDGKFEANRRTNND